MRNVRPIGFTLIELMIVVAVIAILALVALPSYLEQVRKGKRAEAVQAIGDMQLREERWRAENPTYGNTTAASGALGNLLGSVAAVTSFNTQYNNYNISATGNSATGYTITATRKGSMVSDPRCGNLVLTVTNGVAVKSMSSGDTAYCWRK